MAAKPWQRRIAMVRGLLKESLAPKQIAGRLSVSRKLVSKDIQRLRKQSGSRLPSFIPQKGRWVLGKERAGKIEQFTLFARNVIKGKKKFEKQKRKVAIDEKKCQCSESPA